MKVKLLAAIATFALALGVHQSALAQDGYTVEDYFPLTENYHAWFEGDGIEFSSFDVYFDYIEDNYVQTRTVSGTSMLEIYQVTEDTLYLWYQEPEMYDPDNYIPNIKDIADVPVDVPLQAPLEVGNYWETASGAREIINIDHQMDINGTTYSDVIIVREYPDYEVPEGESVEMYKYYAPGVGFVQDVFHSNVEGEDPYVVTSVLDTLDTSGTNHQTVVVGSDDSEGAEKEGSEEEGAEEEVNSNDPNDLVLENEGQVAAYNIHDYFPFIANYHAWFEGTGNEYASFDVFFDYIDEDYLQTRRVSGTSLLEIYQITDEALYLWNQQEEMYDPENLIPEIRETANVPIDIPLQAPLEVGHTWETESGTRVIINVDHQTDINGTVYEDVIIVREYPFYEIPEGETVEIYKHYAPGLGLVEEIYYTTVDGVEQFSVTSWLSNLETEGEHETVIVGTEDDGTEDDGTEDDGTEEDGSEEDGTEDDGTEDDGTEDDGTEEDGTEEDGTEEDGTEEDGTEEEDTDADVGYSANDYFPLTQNYHAFFETDGFFEGSGLEYDSYETYFDFIDEDFVQTRTVSGNSLVEIYEATEEAVYLWYSQPEIYVRENFISRVRSQADVPLDVIIQAPIEVNNYWETAHGAREIVSIDETVTIGDETYEDVLKIQVFPNYETAPNEQVQKFEYYAPNVGLVKEEFTGVMGNDDTPHVVTSNLNRIETDGWYETVTVFVPDEQGMYLEPVEYELFVETDDFMRGEFASIFAGEHDGIPQIAPDGLTINFMYTHWNNYPADNRLYVDLSSEITELRGSTNVLMTLEAILHTIQNYYPGTSMIVTVDNEPFHADGIQFEEGEVYVPDESLVNEPETAQ